MSNFDLDLLQEFERKGLGYEPKDLKGQTFLKSNLVPFQSFLLQLNQKQESEASLYLNLPLAVWTSYPKYLADHLTLDRPDFSHSIQQVIDFVIWLKQEKLSELNANNIQMALKYGQKEIERGLILKKHLKDYVQNIILPPLQTYDLNSVELELSWLKFQDNLEATEPYYGEYEVITKDSEQNRVYYQSTQSEKKVILSFPDAIFDQIQKGDLFHLEYEETKEQHQRFKNIEYHFPNFDLVE